MTAAGDAWFDEQAGPLVPSYAVTRGRTRAPRELSMITLVVAVRQHPQPAHLDPEYAEILGLCRHPLSIAEIAAKLYLSLTVAKILTADLIDSGYLIFRSPPPQTDTPTPDLPMLRKVLDGIRRL
jgi:hypothetical protein